MASSMEKHSIQAGGMRMRSGEEEKVHVLAIPYPAQGHINPMLHLCHLLLPRGFSFTLLNTQHNHDRILKSHPSYAHNKHTSHNTIHANLNHDGGDGDASDRAKLGVPSIRMVCIPGGVPPELHAYKDLKVHAFTASAEMQLPLEEFLASMQAEASHTTHGLGGVDEHGKQNGGPVSFILADVFLGWVHECVGPKFGLPTVAFWAASAASYSTMLHLADLAAEGKTFQLDGMVHGIPGLPPTEIHFIPKLWDEEGFPNQMFLRYFKNMDKYCFLLLNTFKELEGTVIEALSNRVKTLAVGPLLPPKLVTKDDPAGRMNPWIPSLFREDWACIDWLDAQAPQSVLFISFGSISIRSEAQMAELSKALQASSCPFLWVGRAGHDSISEYITNTEGPQQPQHPPLAPHLRWSHGLVVQWAPQLRVLSHPSIGGFLTHCGWNSIVESLACGVPMLCWADSEERLSNQRFVVDFWKCGMDVAAERGCGDDGRSIVESGDVERKIREFMFEDVGMELRHRASQLKHASAAALHESSACLDYLGEAMKDMVTHRKGVTELQYSGREK